MVILGVQYKRKWITIVDTTQFLDGRRSRTGFETLVFCHAELDGLPSGTRLVSASKYINPNTKIRNPKQYQNLNDKNSKPSLTWQNTFWTFEF